MKGEPWISQLGLPPPPINDVIKMYVLTDIISDWFWGSLGNIFTSTLEACCGGFLIVGSIVTTVVLLYLRKRRMHA